MFDFSIGVKSYPKRSSLSEGGFGILFEARNFRGNNVSGIENVEIELARSIIIHNVKKIEKNMDLNVLKMILKFIRKQKENCRGSIEILYQLKGCFLVNENGYIYDVNISLDYF